MDKIAKELYNKLCKASGTNRIMLEDCITPLSDKDLKIAINRLKEKYPDLFKE